MGNVVVTGTPAVGSRSVPTHHAPPSQLALFVHFPSLDTWHAQVSNCLASHLADIRGVINLVLDYSDHLLNLSKRTLSHLPPRDWGRSFHLTVMGRFLIYGTHSQLEVYDYFSPDTTASSAKKK